jgi:hypothetical protein
MLEIEELNIELEIEVGNVPCKNVISFIDII